MAGSGNTYRSNMLIIPEQNPELKDSQAANPGNGEETNPFDAHCSSKSDPSRSQPKPPRWCKSLFGTLLVLICEACPGQSGDGGEDNEW
jgi:hypothetical protein